MQGKGLPQLQLNIKANKNNFISDNKHGQL